ncbi:MAG: hypothetical protein ACPGU1_07915 [Myxococcota bacterium]
MRAMSRCLILVLALSLPLFGVACGGDVGPIGDDTTPIGGDGTTGTGDDVTTDVASCDVDAERRCSEAGGVEVCLDGSWQAGEACGEGLVCDAGECVVTCAASCEGKVCGDDGCGGVCGICKDDESCDDAGQCVSGACEASCEGKTCGDDGCGGMCGMCAEGETCTDGACTACTPSCGSKVCGDDGCGGSCGECGDSETCLAGQCQPCMPSCEGVVCGDDGCGGTCGACADGESCVDGQCGACTPSCDGLACGDDGCGGSCGECADGESCVAGACQDGAGDGCGGVTYEGCCNDNVVQFCDDGALQEIDCAEAPQGSCGWNAEGGFYDCGTDGAAEPTGAHPYQCEGADECEPSCEGITCGGDGCGGTCGTCEEGLQCIDGGCIDTGCPTGEMLDCNEECIAMAWLGDTVCDAGLNCEAFDYDGGDCTIPCAEGEINDCAGACVDGALVGDGTCQDALNCAATEWDGMDCEPACEEGQILNCDLGCTSADWLGDDYCDASLNCEGLEYDAGDCAAPCADGEMYDCAGVCVDGALAGDGTCQEELNCEATQWDGMDCEPSCEEGQLVDCDYGCTSANWLGDDYCDASLNCETFEFDGGDCADEPCEPACGDAVCGDDGCGGECGTCGDGLVCEMGQCAEAPCEPTCGDAECGDDGCGGVCGVCDEGSSCDAGACVEDVVIDPTTCGTIATCVDECGDDAEACVNACVAAGSPEAIADYNAWFACEADCEDGQCIIDTCADEGSQCFWQGTGASNCLEVNDCLQGCEDAECSEGCFADATEAAKAIWLQLLWCNNAVCGLAEPGDDADACWAEAVGQGGACAPYGNACVDDGAEEPVTPPTPEPTSSCSEIASCTGGCDQGDDDCEASCVALGSDETQAAYSAFDACREECDDSDCLQANCAPLAAACLWPDTGELACADVDTCLGGCAADDSACVDGCFESGTADAQATWLQLLWCADENCGDLEDPSEYSACWASAVDEGGDCADYVAACGLAGDEPEPQPLPTADCGEIASCAFACEVDDTGCVDACVATGNDADAASFNALDGCLEGCPDMSCVLDSCAPSGAACMWPGAGNATCLDVNDCLGGCEGDALCADACLAAGSDTAKTIWMQINWCVNAACSGLSGDEASVCQDDALGAGGECESYVTACYFDEPMPEPAPEPVDGLSCGGIYTCQGDCEVGDDACVTDCIAAGASAAQELYDAADACFTGCGQVDNVQGCWSENCTGVGAECFYETAGSGTCVDTYNCLDACGNSFDFQACAADCVSAASTEGQEQVLALEWCVMGACDALTEVDEIQACQAEAVGAGGACEAPVDICLGADDL